MGLEVEASSQIISKELAPGIYVSARYYLNVCVRVCLSVSASVSVCVCLFLCVCLCAFIRSISSSDSPEIDLSPCEKRVSSWARQTIGTSLSSNQENRISGRIGPLGCRIDH